MVGWSKALLLTASCYNGNSCILFLAIGNNIPSQWKQCCTVLCHLQQYTIILETVLQTVPCHWQQYTITMETVLHCSLPFATVYHYIGNSVAFCYLPLVTVYHYNGNSVADCSLPLVRYIITMETVLHTVPDAIGNSIPIQRKQCCRLFFAIGNSIPIQWKQCCRLSLASAMDGPYLLTWIGMSFQVVRWIIFTIFHSNRIILYFASHLT